MAARITPTLRKREQSPLVNQIYVIFQFWLGKKIMKFEVKQFLSPAR